LKVERHHAQRPLPLLKNLFLDVRELLHHRPDDIGELASGIGQGHATTVPVK
jgi:hypothetical protein